MATATKSCITAGQDRYGAFLMIDDYRCAMPSLEWANKFAALPDVLAACKAIQMHKWQEDQIPAELFNLVDDAITKAEGP
jgi:hypothetical protein